MTIMGIVRSCPLLIHPQYTGCPKSGSRQNSSTKRPIPYAMHITVAVSPGRVGPSIHPLPNDEDKHAFDQTGIELAGVPGNINTVDQWSLRKDNRPRDGRRSSPKLSIDEVGDTSEGDAERASGCGGI